MASQLTIGSGILDAQGLQELGALTYDVVVALAARYPQSDPAEQGCFSPIGLQ